MQIFALFMLCGTLVSFLIPETKGRTLEDLAGEAQSTLDRNADPTPVATAWYQKFNPFYGGRPAGFSHSLRTSPALGPRSPGIKGKRERVGIMTSPELLPKKGDGKHLRAGSDVSANGVGYSHSVSSHGRNPDVEDDLYVGGGTLPGWGAGWAVQRNPRVEGIPRPRVESIQLLDVGKLLK